MEKNSFNNRFLFFHENYISIENPNYSGHYDNAIIMHDCEHPIMKEHAKICTKNGGDILEIGFGMGIVADYIQNYNINSHTIIESHFQIADKAREWALNKPNVTIIEDRWQNVYNEGKLKTYDGIMFDPSEFTGAEKMFNNPKYTITKPGCILTYYNGLTFDQIMQGWKINENPENLKIPGTEYTPFNWKQNTIFHTLHQGEVYWIPKKIF
tara:strand:- start:3177 stop:3809 length:633 start_codon:yes stop_codon:yes gene_type:complete